MYFALSLALILLRTLLSNISRECIADPHVLLSEINGLFRTSDGRAMQIADGAVRRWDAVHSWKSRFICKIDERVSEREAASYQSYYIEFRSISSVQRTGSSHHGKSAPQWMSIMPAKACSRGPALINNTVDRRGQQALSPYYRNNSRPVHPKESLVREA